jgi:FAD/FMN-containing dehydrogenase
MDLQAELSKIFKGEVDTTAPTLDFYSHDASLFELRPQVVAFPQDAEDIKATVKFVNEHRAENPELNITPRSRGTDMSGGAIGQSIVLDVSKHMNKLEEVTPTSAHVQPGMLYREFDVETLKQGSILPSYPASRDLASVGGMANNNSGGEMSLLYGKTDNYVTELKVVLSDGNEYTIVPLTRDELNAKMDQDTFEGNLYRQTFDLLDKNYDEIKAAAPKVSKDSTGYHLWNIWNRETGIFDLTKLFVGAQGTLGITTDIKFKLVKKMNFAGTLVCYMPNMSQLGEIIPAVLTHNPTAFESFDDKTLWLSFKFFFGFMKKLGFWKWLSYAFQLIPDGLMIIKGIPKLILLIEFAGDSAEEVTQKVMAAKKDLKRFNFTFMEANDSEAKSEKFWMMRRESFNLLRSKVKDKHTAPFIDDFIVPPARLMEFLPQLQAIIKKYKLMATIAGHMGDGNFHVIPLMKIEDPKERAKLEPAMKEVNELVISYGGSVSGEHNDGMIRGPWLEQMYSPSVLGYMREMKQLYDPNNIFNPRKKTDATWDFSFSHIREKF